MLTNSLNGCIIILLIHRGVEQLAARWAHNPKVASSSLAPATKSKVLLLCVNTRSKNFFI